MGMNPTLAVQACRITPPEKLSDRFILCEALRGPGHVLLTYIFEVTKPWFPSSRLLPSLQQVIADNVGLLKSGDELADNFELLLKKINQQLNTISEAGETDWIGNLNGIIMVLGGNQLHFSQTGRCPAYLLQKNRIRQITDDPGDEKEAHPLKTFANLSSGNLQDEDYILLANQELYREVSLDALRRVMQRNSPFQAGMTIVRELKHDRNLAVAAAFLRTHTPNAPVPSEPEEILLEEEMQSTFKRLQKKAKPYLDAAKRGAATAGKASVSAAQKGHAIIAPKAQGVLDRISHRGQQMKEQFVKASLPPESESLDMAQEMASQKAEELQEEVVEMPAVQGVTAETAEVTTHEEHEGEAAQEDVPHEEAEPMTTSRARFEWKSVNKAVRRWLRPVRNRRIAAVGLAAMFIGTTFAIAFHTNKGGASHGSTLDSNATLLTDAASLQKKAATAVELKQDVEAGREIAQAQKDLISLQDLGGDQKVQADQIWNALIGPADSISQTTRLAQASATYALGGTTQDLVANAPYFYGFASGGSSLLRARQAVDSTPPVALTDTTDSIISVTQPSDAASAALVLTRKAKVYRVTQTGDTTALTALSTTTGSFATADDIASYIGNIYLLDGTSGLLWKYAATGTGSYAKGVSIVDINKYDLKGSVSLTIDGSVYVLKKDGSVMKFTSGAAEDGFAIKGLPSITTIQRPLAILTDSTMADFYLLDGGITSSPWSTAKVLEFHKDGTFVRQYGFPTALTDVRAFDINPQDKKLWVANGATVNEFALP